MAKVTAGRDELGTFAPKFAEVNDDILFGEIWSREDKLSARDRSIVTVTALMASGILDNSLKFHLSNAKIHGVTKEEIAEILTPCGFLCRLPKWLGRHCVWQKRFGRDNQMKRVLIISASPRKNGNSDILCDRFAKGAAESGHKVEKIFLASENIGYCRGCGVCNSTHKCVQKDDMAEILDKMVTADAIVLATPVYFYTMDGQMKTFIDRTVPRYTEITDKDFYFIMTALTPKKETLPVLWKRSAVYGGLSCRSERSGDYLRHWLLEGRRDKRHSGLQRSL